MTLVCFAMKEEAGHFQRLAGTRSDCEVLLTGIGRRNAGTAIRAALSKSRPELVLSCGFAGGLRSDLTTGTVLFWLDGVIAPSEPRLPSSSSQLLRSLESSLLAAGARPGRFHCSDRVACTAQEKAALWGKTTADAVEMESQIICTVCREENTPSAIVRVILDASAEDLPLDFNLLCTPDQNLDFVKLAGTLLKSPGRIPALIRLQKQSHAAAQKLAQVLVKCVPAHE